MKKIITIVVSVVAFFVIFYFSTWFFLGQVPVLKIKPYVAPLSETFNNFDNFPTVFNKLNKQFDADFNKNASKQNKVNSSGKGFYPTVKEIFADCQTKLIDWNSYTDEKKVTVILDFWGDFVNLALSRAQYSSKTVPLGAMKNVLLDYIKAYKGKVALIGSSSENELYSRVEKNYRTYASLIFGRDVILRAYLKSGEMSKIKIVCAEVKQDRIKDMKDDLGNLFKNTQDESLKMTLAQALLTIQYTDPMFDQYVLNKLKILLNSGEYYDFLSLVGSSGNQAYIKPLQDMLPSYSADIQEALKNAVLKLKG